MKVLLADDSSSSRALLTRLMTSWGYEVVECSTGTQAWEALQGENPPGIAVLDWVMPGLDGTEVCRRLRAEQHDTYTFVFLLTARDSQEDLLAGLEAGADDYLTKPFSPAELKVRLRNGQRIVEMHNQLVAARESMRLQATIDPLTGAYNRRAFGEIAVRALNENTGQRGLALVLIDLDHFKKVNDTYGHRAGDAVLIETVKRLRHALRGGDRLGRLGGEELAVVLPECGAAGAWAVSERLRREIAKRPVSFEGKEIEVTASFGVAIARTDEPIEHLTERADRALYQAKHGGRNRTVVASVLPEAQSA